MPPKLLCQIGQLTLAGSRLDCVRGTSDLRGSVIESHQVIPLAAAMAAEIGITIDDDFASSLDY
jgi:hypothetical protein